MIPSLALAAFLVGGPLADAPVCLDVPSVAVVGDETLRTLYSGGRPYGEFLSAATRRTELWHGNTAKSEGIDMALVARARAVAGSWRFLAVAIDSCSDSVSTIPYLARLVSMVDGLDMRIVDPTAGRAIMEAHRTPDGRAATPTVLLLNDQFEEAGCFIERPSSLQAWILADDGTFTSVDQKMEWYAQDSGQETLATFVEMLEAAASGRAVCR